MRLITTLLLFRFAALPQTGTRRWTLASTLTRAAASRTTWLRRTTGAWERSQSGPHRASRGEPDTVSTSIEPSDILATWHYRQSSGPALFVTVADTLAYPTQLELADGSLITDRGTFEPGASLAEVERAFPKSYRCRDWPLGAGWLYGDAATQLIVEDTARAATLALWFENEKLKSVGVSQYAPVSELQQAAQIAGTT